MCTQQGRGPDKKEGDLCLGGAPHQGGDGTGLQVHGSGNKGHPGSYFCHLTSLGEEGPTPAAAVGHLEPHQRQYEEKES